MNETKPEPTQPTLPIKPAAKPAAPKPEEKQSNPTLAGFDTYLATVPKEWLPSMMVRIANKCLAEKVFANPGAMAEAIVGASKK